ncbi:DUF2399 domain-containing protein [Lentzea guizhouensis]|uniref:DUF2399 domain-containing protein n=1 Tax=Lentzea guizhouensis TaxID=1586287 RepID=UPI001F2CEF4A|nr:DUF2399 domain-containing protein [Lentzea guizhouensis]
MGGRGPASRTPVRQGVAGPAAGRRHRTPRQTALRPVTHPRPREPRPAAAFPASRRVRLTGAPVDARWDPALTPAMTHTGHCVEEEPVLDDLLDDLSA